MLRADIVGGGLAGCEAAWQLAERGVDVTLREMKPEKRTNAHRLNGLAELVCSNSLRSARLTNAVGLLKAEMEVLGSITMQAAYASRVQAGGALAVDRLAFSEFITASLTRHPHIHLLCEEVRTIPDPPVILAPGPLCSDDLACAIAEKTGSRRLSFFDAVAPIVSADSVDMSKTFWGSRYDRGDDYLNCPMSADEYGNFQTELVNAERAVVHELEDEQLFDGCMPIESMAERGFDTMRFGPLKPKGIRHPVTGAKYHAVVQLRRENEAATMFNLVGFQTRLRFGEQKRVFSMIPGLEHAEFLRYGVMHRNTYLDAPRVLSNRLELLNSPGIYFAGQITGVEGYVESAATGMLAGLFLAEELHGRQSLRFENDTALGALITHVTNSTTDDFQPMNVNYGLMAPLTEKIRNKRERYERLANRSLARVREIRINSSLF